MNVTIRQATIEDLKTVQEFGYKLLKYEHDNWDPILDLNWPFSEGGEANYTKAINERYTLLAELDGKPVGFLIGSIRLPDPKAPRQITAAQLDNIFVDDEVRGQGIGEKLFDEFKEYCLSKKADTLSVAVTYQNEIATRFYEKIGFVPSRMVLKQELSSSR